jgi:hypothetical protein
METSTPSNPGSLKVIKKLPPNGRGALRLAQRYGEALVCVRHRSDAQGKHRFTTVELLIDKTPIQRKADPIVGLRIGPEEKPLQAAVRAAGGTWDYKAKLWHISRRAAATLKLTDRIAEK